jgi:membrane-bound lytic murein transglycosylase A
VLCVALGVLLAACAQPRGLVRLESPRLEWQDDGSALRLSRAIDGSIAYYQRIPPETVFRYGPELYTPAELIASLELFRQEFLTAPDAGTFAQRIEERFLVFESIREDSPNLFTGYYEPELEASETATESLDTPIYALPQDMVKVRLDRFGGSLPPVTLVGRVVDGELVPYYTRREIQGAGALTERAEPIAYVNAVDLFFLQIQGSGVLRFPDGRRVKVGYAASNGHPYRSIGALLVRQEALPLEEVSLQSIRAWLSRNPEQRERILFANPSYVFFHIRDEGPLGNLRVELTPGRSLAADQRLLPAGSLAYVMTDAPLPDAPGATRAVRRFMLVQDTGGAIRGHGRGDLFWGAGPDAEWIAGHQKHAGRLLLLVARKEFLPASTAGSP